MAWADNVAKIGTTEYATLQAAIDAASNGQTVTLLMDIATGTDSYEIGKQITIDLGGKTITANHANSNDKLFAITSVGKLTITGEGTITDDDVRGIFYNEGTLTIENGTFTTTNNDGYAVIYNTGSTAFCSVKGGTFTGAYAAVYNVSDATMTINNGSFVAASIGIVARGGSELTIADGSIKGTSSDAIFMEEENTKVTISGGTVSGKNGVDVQTKASLIVNDGATITGTNAAIIGNGSADKGGTSITINGGTITNDVDIAIYHPQSGSLTIKGGTITGVSGIEMKGGSLVVDDDAVITATYTGTPTHNPYGSGTSTTGYAIAIVENGGYAGVSTVKISKEAEINGPVAVVKDSDKSSEAPEITFDPEGMQMSVKVTDNSDKVVGQYISLELAVENAPTGSTITLLDAVDITSTIETTKDFTLDLNDKTLTSNGQRALWIKSGTVTINATTGGTISVPATASSTESAIRVGSDETTTASLTVNNGVKISATESLAISVEGVNTEGASLMVNGIVEGPGGIEIKGGSLTIGSAATITATETPSHVANNTGCSSNGYAIAVVQNNVNGTKVNSVSIDNAATITGPVAQLFDSEVTGFNPTYTGKYTTKVASIEKDEYFTLNDAINIVPSQGTVKLIDNLELTSTFMMDAEKTYTFDLNGKTLTGNNCAAIQITHGHVTLDGTIGSKVTVSGTPAAAIQLGATDTEENRNVSLIINENVEVTSTVSTGVLLSGTKTRETLELKGKITTSGADHIAIKAEDEVAKIHVANGAQVTASNALAIHQANTGELVIDGSVTGTDAIKMYGGNLKVSKDATITATPTTNYAIAIVEKADCAGVGKANISNESHIMGVIACLVESKNTCVAEPQFTGDITMVAETQNSNGLGEKYAKLSDAIAAAIDSKEVKLLEDITVTEAVPVSKAITLNMDDYSIVDNQTSGATMTIGANVTIKNGGITSEKGGISITAGTIALQSMTVNTKGVSLGVSGGTVTADQKTTLSSSENNTVALSGGVLTMSGKVLNTSTASHAISGTSTGTLTVVSTATISSANSNAINWASSGALTVEGGKIAGSEAVYATNGEITINGGTFTGTGNALNVAGGTPVVNGGTFICGTTGEPIVATSATYFVKGDYFSKKIAQDLCYSGYMVSENPKNNGMFYLVSEIVINDGTQWEIDDNAEDFPIGTAKYIRNSGMGAAGTKFGTLCLPFSINPLATTGIPTGMKFYAVSSINSDKSIITITELTSEIAAGTPVIFLFENATTNFEIVSTGATVSRHEPRPDNNLVGTLHYRKETIESGLEDIYYLNSDAFHQATQSLTVPAYRAYIKFPVQSPSPMPNVLYISTEQNEETELKCLFEDDSVDGIYDFNGKRQEELKPGLNIMKMKNGRTIKVYVNK